MEIKILGCSFVLSSSFIVLVNYLMVFVFVVTKAAFAYTEAAFYHLISSSWYNLTEIRLIFLLDFDNLLLLIFIFSNINIIFVFEFIKEPVTIVAP